jgi:hypothetical protein
VLLLTSLPNDVNRRTQAYQQRRDRYLDHAAVRDALAERRLAPRNRSIANERVRAIDPDGRVRVRAIRHRSSAPAAARAHDHDATQGNADAFSGQSTLIGPLASTVDDTGISSPAMPDVAPVPEPATLTLLGGLCALALRRRARTWWRGPAVRPD